MIVVPLLADFIERESDIFAIAGGAAFCLASWVMVAWGIWSAVAALLALLP